MLAIWVRFEEGSIPAARAERILPGGGFSTAMGGALGYELREGAALVSKHDTREDAERVALERNSPWALG